MASLVNMETSKVNDYEYTVFTAIKGMFRKNPYMPREVRDYKEGQQEIDWEKADLCPVAMAEAMVKEHIIEDYDALELLILRLYDIGFHSLDALTSLSGMNRDIVERALNSEIMVYHHIDDEEKKLRKWAERPLKKMKKEERADGIVPRESVEQDEELCREINERIKE